MTDGPNTLTAVSFPVVGQDPSPPAIPANAATALKAVAPADGTVFARVRCGPVSVAGQLTAGAGSVSNSGASLLLTLEVHAGDLITLTLTASSGAIRTLDAAVLFTQESVIPGDLLVIGNLFVDGTINGSSSAGWPTVNATGPGNLVAQTAPTDTTGYTFNDRGTGGILLETQQRNIALTANGTGSINLSAGGGIELSPQSGLLDLAGQAGAVLQGGGGGNPVDIGQPGDAVTCGAGTGTLGFYGAGPIAQQSGASITTVAQVVTALRNLGLLS